MLNLYRELRFLYSWSQNQFYFRIKKIFRTIFLIKRQIDYFRFKIQGLNCEFRDQLTIKNPQHPSYSFPCSLRSLQEIFSGHFFESKELSIFIIFCLLRIFLSF